MPPKVYHVSGDDSLFELPSKAIAGIQSIIDALDDDD
jgi:hypothetical protein